MVLIPLKEGARLVTDMGSQARQSHSRPGGFSGWTAGEQTFSSHLRVSVPFRDWIGFKKAEGFACPDHLLQLVVPSLPLALLFSRVLVPEDDSTRLNVYAFRGLFKELCTVTLTISCYMTTHYQLC